ncbi:MAG: hypothetical protein COC00_002270 [Rhizobiales bacterium]|nr:hypothetical protein [Hyphomicrobiales bacterium]
MHALKKTIMGTVLGTAIIGSAITVTPAAAEEVYMIRGFLNVFSAGMNQMTSKLKRAGVRATAHSNGEWSKIADDIIRRNKRGKVSFPIVVAGHSLGGVELPQFANKLGKAGIPVKLVIGLDAGFANPQPFRKGAQSVIHYKIPNGNSFRRGAGFKGSISNRIISGVDHVGIDKSPKVQRLVIANIRKAVGK